MVGSVTESGTGEAGLSGGAEPPQKILTTAKNISNNPAISNAELSKWKAATASAQEMIAYVTDFV